MQPFLGFLYAQMKLQMSSTGALCPSALLYMFERYSYSSLALLIYNIINQLQRYLPFSCVDSLFSMIAGN